MRNSNPVPGPPATHLPPRKEWDFRAKPEKAAKGGDWSVGHPFDFLPDDEVWRCWHYEFTRDGPEVPYVLAKRAGIPAPADFDAHLAHYWRTDPNGKEGCAPEATCSHYLWPEWPTRPFLSVPLAERQRRYHGCWKDNPKRQLPLIPLSDLFRLEAALINGDEQPPSTDWLRGRGVKMEPSTWVLRRHSDRAKVPPSEVVALELDYKLPNGVLVKRFANWLHQHRKQQGYTRQDQRGRSETKELRAALHSLGAIRLQDAGLSINQAIEHTEKVSGLSLYADPGDWSKAREIVRNALDRAN